jgi:chorismate mutase / prephenate dehydratase
MKLEDIRPQIDQVDDQIAQLIRKRFSLVEEVAGIKKSQHLPVTDSSREREIVNRLTQGTDEEMRGYLKIFFHTLFDLSRSHQLRTIHTESKTAKVMTDALANTPQMFPKNAVIACQGAEGANSTLASEKFFNHPTIMYVNTFEGVFSAVDKGLCQYGILPIENNLHGPVTEIYDLMHQYRAYIAKSLKLKINHVLLAKPGTKLSQIKKIYSHEQALAQCGNFLKNTKAQIEPCENTAVAAKFVAASSEEGVAAISSAYCADLYNLEIIKEGIQNSDNNYTKFICISKKPEVYPGSNKISIMVVLSHRPGALYHFMSKFAAYDINLTKIESRPIPDSDFDFSFFFDFDISVYDDSLASLFAQLEDSTKQFAFLGCYTEQ